MCICSRRLFTQSCHFPSLLSGPSISVLHFPSPRLLNIRSMSKCYKPHARLSSPMRDARERRQKTNHSWLFSFNSGQPATRFATRLLSSPSSTVAFHDIGGVMCGVIWNHVNRATGVNRDLWFASVFHASERDCPLLTAAAAARGPFQQRKAADLMQVQRWWRHDDSHIIAQQCHVTAERSPIQCTELL